MHALSDFQRQKFDHELTKRQAQVLELVAKRRTLKQIASELSISESAINQHIKALKASLGVNSLAGLADVHRMLTECAEDSDYIKSTCRKSGLSEGSENSQRMRQDDLEPTLSFQDAISYTVAAPWEYQEDPVVVPRVLNGANAKLVRSAYIVGIAIGFFILVLTGLGIAQGLTAAFTR